VELHSRYFHMCSASHVRRFCDNSERYVRSSGDVLTGTVSLPMILPARVAFLDCVRISAAHCELRGNCPVTLLNNLEQRGAYVVTAGDANLCVEYSGRIFRCASMLQLERFLRHPKRYSVAKLPQKMPMQGVKETTPKQLLALGKTLAFMERSMAAMTMEALAALGDNRIKHPRLSLSKSAAVFVGLYLKAHNPRARAFERTARAAQLAAYVKTCALIPRVNRFYKLGDFGLLKDPLILERLAPLVRGDEALRDQVRDVITSASLQATADPATNARVSPILDALRGEKRALLGAFDAAMHHKAVLLQQQQQPTEQ
jgi:hypothetical protein